ncbi:MAG: alanine/ornithine racemase family PLP-dependent enzyme [Sediminibacterium sp.]
MENFPKILWNEAKLRDNIRFLNNFFDLQSWPITWVPVSKSICAYPDIIKILLDEGISEIADSRIKNLKAIKSISKNCRTLLLRLPGFHEIKDVIQYADTSLISEIKTLEKLQDEAKLVGIKHRVILMIELGDLREGALPKDIIEIGRFILKQDHIDWCGIGTNLTCYGGVLPTKEKMTSLLKIKDSILVELGHNLSVISGGNSSTLSLMFKGDMPEGISQLRLGEALFLGRETTLGTCITGMHSDIFTIEAEVIEVKTKHSIPEGEIGADAFGKKPIFKDVGLHSRAIVAIGRQDIPIEGLIPIDENIQILGGSSDHMILDVQSSQVKVGDILKFNINYPALLQAMTSPYIKTENC